MDKLEETAILSKLDELLLDLSNEDNDTVPVTLECESCEDSHKIREGEPIRVLVSISSNTTTIKGISCVTSNMHPLFERNLNPNEFIVIVDGYLEVGMTSEPILKPTNICSRTEPSLKQTQD